MLNESDKAIIDQYVDEKYFDKKKLIKYLELHDFAGNEVFSICCRRVPEGHQHTFPYSNIFFQGYDYNPVPIETFIKRIPFYFYIIPDDVNKASLVYKENTLLGNLSDILACRSQPNRIADTEETYQILEYLFYEKGIHLLELFSYTATNGEILDSMHFISKWKHYLELKKENDSMMPENFIVRYNEVLEENGLPPIIYEVQELGREEYFFRYDDSIEFEGVFPSTKDGTPILKWIGLDIKNAKSVSLLKKMGIYYQRLIVELAPDTVIHAKNIHNYEDKEDFWYLVYAGPKTIRFDHEALKDRRQYLRYTQKEVAEAVGAAVRTYQKWETGDSTPDGHYLLRLINWLNIENVQDITKHE